MKQKEKEKERRNAKKKRGIKCGGESSQLISKIPRLSLLN